MSHAVRPENFSRKDKSLYAFKDRKGPNTNSVTLKHHLAFTSLLQPNQCVYIAIHHGTNDTKSAEQLSGAFKWIIILGYGIFHSVLSFKQMGVGN
jgi:hypothetical protein